MVLKNKVKNNAPLKPTKTTIRATTKTTQKKSTTTTTRKTTRATKVRVTTASKIKTTTSINLAVRQQSANKRKNTSIILLQKKTTQRPRPRPTKRRPRTTKRPILSVTTTTEVNEIPRKQNILTSPNRIFEANNITVKSLYKCDFSTPDSCGVKTAGKQWFFLKGYYAVGLTSGEKTQLLFSNTVAPPEPKDGGIACLTFRYKKYFPGIMSLKYYLCIFKNYGV